MRAIVLIALLSACQGAAIIETDPAVIAQGQPTPDPVTVPVTNEPTPEPTDPPTPESFFLTFDDAFQICIETVQTIPPDNFQSECGFDQGTYLELCQQLELLFLLDCDTNPGRFDECIVGLVDQDSFCNGTIPFSCETFIDGDDVCF